MYLIDHHACTVGQNECLRAQYFVSQHMPAARFRLSTLSLAVAAALSVMAMHSAQADAPISGSVSGPYTWASGDLLINPGVAVSGGSDGVVADSASLGILRNSGQLSGSFSGIYIDGNTIDRIENASSGSINGRDYGIAIFSSSSLVKTLVNSGTISSPNGTAAISNEGTINTLINNSGGIILGGDLTAGIYNRRNIGVLTNSGTIKGGVNQNNSLLAYSYGIQNDNRATIGTLNNNSGGIIYGHASGIYNYTSSGTALITELNNSGLIDGGGYGIWNDERGKITTLNNLADGTINNGILNGSSSAAGTITTLNNAGTIIDTSTVVTPLGPYASSPVDDVIAIHNVRGTIGTLNNSGLISAIKAIVIETNGIITTLINSGTIAGNIINNSTRVQTISGGTGTVFGSLTGLNDSIGLITNTRSNWVFGGGNQLLNNNINVGTNKVINSAGVLQLNNQINITGNYQQNAAATLNIGVGNSATSNGNISDGGYGRLIVSGAAVIDTGSSVALKKTGSYRFANGQRYLVIQAASSGTNYNEATLQYQADGYRGDITGSSLIDGSNLGLLLTLDGEIINPASDANSRFALEGLFKYTGTDAALMNLFNAGAALGTQSDANRAGSQLGPSSITFGIVGAADTLGRHLTDVAFNRLDHSSSPTASDTSGLSGGDGISDKAGWGQFFGGRASDDGRDGVSGYHAGYTGLLLGADTELNKQWRAGGLLSYASTSVSNDGDNAGSYANVDSYGVTAYAGYTAEPWYLNMSVSAMRSDIDAHRVMDFSGFNGTANSSYKGMQYIAAVRGGYPINVSDMVVTPLAGLTYSSLRLDSYTETGGNGAALRVDAADTYSLKSDVGFKLERSYKTSYGLLKPTAQLLWRHEYSGTRMQSVANFAADTSGATTFVTQGPTPVADTGVLLLGATLLRNDNLTLSANYTLEMGGGYTAQTGSLLARWRF
jgi:outer membrane autotransporter protein